MFFDLRSSYFTQFSGGQALALHVAPVCLYFE